jgi:hypothetical protein
MVTGEVASGYLLTLPQVVFPTSRMAKKKAALLSEHGL